MNQLPLTVQEHIKSNADSVRKNLKKCDQNDNKKRSPKRNANHADAARYYQLKMQPSPNFISYVNRRDNFDQMMTYLSCQHLVAFDAEWNPMKTSSAELALIQLATAERIFLIDVISEHITLECWNRLATHVFNNLEILKIGNNHWTSVNSFKIAAFYEWITRKSICIAAFSPLADLKLLQKLMPTFNVSVQMMQSYLDLQAFWQKLNQMPAFKFPFEGKRGHCTHIYSVNCQLMIIKLL